ncbi:MAG TPA: hypothetical protein VNW49_11465 [Puia sp.]|nr:hypothetical protein [Puia sp.]
MKTLFAILFLIDTGLLVCMSYLFLQMLDMDGNLWLIILDFAGMMTSIIGLAFLLSNYIKQPSDNRPNKT